MGVDGLASGLNTTDLINQLMQVEAMPQTLLKSKQSQSQSLVAGLQGLNTRIASLAEAARNTAKVESWNAYSATSSATGTTAVAGSTAQPGTVTFHVDRIATTQVSVSAATRDDGSFVTSDPPALTIRKKDGTLVTVEARTGSLSDLAKALNDSPDAGVKATVVRVSNGTEPTYRLQLTGTQTGEDGSFELFAGAGSEVAAGTAPSLLEVQVRAAENAQVTLWKGVAGLEQTYSQSSNTFSGLMAGVDVTVSKATAADEEQTTITVGRDDAALTKLASGLVGAMGVVLSEITSRTATTTKTNADGTTSVTGGLFSADSAVRGIQQQLTTAMSLPVDGRSPSEVGIVIGRDGTFTFDEKVFGEALAADPAKVQSMVSQLAARVADVAGATSDKYEGSLTLKIQSQEGLVKDMGSQIEGWDRRLEVRRQSLSRTYAALEVTLNKMQSQSSWLAGQLASLPTYGS
ncbi:MULTISPECIES: flagellar filament capping protein FliD [unclassified Actinotalea]|uniref:flagellar filament capping protein FliD n=1 Tax=unclassified Actinotalea TaxID=2638618 RepID=UPI0015F45648|nr:MULTISPECIES: flagellar filament capping protein FliD [unclassified Actinotalea]